MSQNVFASLVLFCGKDSDEILISRKKAQKSQNSNRVLLTFLTGIFVADDEISNGQRRRVEETMIDGSGKYVSREIVTSL